MNIEYLEVKVREVSTKVRKLLSKNSNIINFEQLKFNLCHSTTSSQNIYSTDNLEILYIDGEETALEFILKFRTIEEFFDNLITNSILLEPFNQNVCPIFKNIIDNTYPLKDLLDYDFEVEYKSYIIMKFDNENNLSKINLQLITTVNNNLFFYDYEYKTTSTDNPISFNMKVKDYYFEQTYNVNDLSLLDTIRNYIIYEAYKDNNTDIDFSKITLSNYTKYLSILKVVSY